jgi:trehalose 6-phosphate phosphatase
LKIYGPPSLINKIRKAPRLKLFLDYDGTLAEFARTPDEIHPDKQLIDLLRMLVDTPNIEPAIISGRRLGHIQQLIPLKGLWLAGTYGIELQNPEGALINRVDYQNIRPVITNLIPLWQTLIEPTPGFYLEDKGWSVALHGKNADQAVIPSLFQTAEAKAQRVIQGENNFRILGGEKFLEVAPKLADKAQSLEFLTKQMNIGDSLLVYIGDDDKDEAAFRVIAAKNGISIKVCQHPCPTVAPLRLKNPMDVRKFLASLAAKT